MRPFIKLTIWLATAFVGLFVWNAAPDFRPILTWLLPVAIVGYAAVFSVQTTNRRLVSDELIGLRQQLDLSIGQLTTLNRKVTALLEDALERRQQR